MLTVYLKYGKSLIVIPVAHPEGSGKGVPPRAAVFRGRDFKCAITSRVTWRPVSINLSLWRSLSVISGEVNFSLSK